MKKLLGFLISYKLHILLWVIYIAYESILIGFFYQRFGKFENYATHYSLNIFLFYINLWVLESMNFKSKGNYLKIPFLAALEILLYIPLLAQLNQWFTDFNQPTASNLLGIDHRFILGAIYRSLFFILISTGFWFLKRFLNEQENSKKLENERLQAIIEKESIKTQLVIAENAFMRSQVNPHFLFNTLSFVYRRIKKNDSDAGDLLFSLAKMIRYTVSLDLNTKVVLLSEEIEQVENLINLFQIREGHSLSIHLDYQDGLQGEQIIPLALLTLCENVFKHGVLNDSSSPAIISIKSSNGLITIKTENKISRRTNDLSTGRGLKNLSQRINLHYAGNANFKYFEQGGRFKANLEIYENAATI